MRMEKASATPEHDIDLVVQASEVRAKLMNAMKCAGTMFDKNVQCVAHILSLNDENHHQQRSHDAEIQVLRGRISALLAVVAEQQKQLDSTQKLMALKNLWVSLIAPGILPSKPSSSNVAHGKFDEHKSENTSGVFVDTGVTGDDAALALAILSSHFAKEISNGRKESALAARKITSVAPPDSENSGSGLLLHLLENISTIKAALIKDLERQVAENRQLRSALHTKAARVQTLETQLNSTMRSTERETMFLEDMHSKTREYADRDRVAEEDCKRLHKLNANLLVEIKDVKSQLREAIGQMRQSGELADSWSDAYKSLLIETDHLKIEKESLKEANNGLLRKLVPSSGNTSTGTRSGHEQSTTTTSRRGVATQSHVKAHGHSNVNSIYIPPGDASGNDSPPPQHWPEAANMLSPIPISGFRTSIRTSDNGAAAPSSYPPSYTTPSLGEMIQGGNIRAAGKTLSGGPGSRTISSSSSSSSNATKVAGYYPGHGGSSSGGHAFPSSSSSSSASSVGTTRRGGASVTAAAEKGNFPRGTCTGPGSSLNAEQNLPSFPGDTYADAFLPAGTKMLSQRSSLSVTEGRRSHEAEEEKQPSSPTVQIARPLDRDFRRELNVGTSTSAASGINNDKQKTTVPSSRLNIVGQASEALKVMLIEAQQLHEDSLSSPPVTTASRTSVPVVTPMTVSPAATTTAGTTTAAAAAPGPLHVRPSTVLVSTLKARADKDGSKDKDGSQNHFLDDLHRECDESVQRFLGPPGSSGPRGPRQPIYASTSTPLEQSAEKPPMPPLLVPVYPTYTGVQVPVYPTYTGVQVPVYPTYTGVQVPVYPNYTGVQVPVYPTYTGVQVPVYPTYTGVQAKKPIVSSRIPVPVAGIVSPSPFTPSPSCDRRAGQFHPGAGGIYGVPGIGNMQEWNGSDTASLSLDDSLLREVEAAVAVINAMVE